MNVRVLWIVIVVLLLVIIGLTAVLVLTPAPAKTPAPAAATTTPVATSAQVPPTSPASSSTPQAPLSASVSVSSPQQGALVGQTFSVAGVAPNGWYFEAVFPIKVVDDNDNTITSGQGQAQTDWTTSGPVPFTASISISPPYHGPATLVLLKDNPSGLPQNDDSVSIPIVVQ